MQAQQLFDLPESLSVFSEYFRPQAAPWEWIQAIKTALASLHPEDFSIHAEVPSGVSITDKVHIAPSVKLPPYARIEGPAWIGEHTEIRPGAYIRGNVIIGAHCVVGNACEYKNSLLLDHVQSPHYNYVGDSLLGNYAHLGAGVICSNLRLDQQPIRAYTPEGRTDTGMRKLGAILGDHAEVGCNSALQPGCILGKRAVVMPVMAFSGYLPPNTLACEKNEWKAIPRQD